jgi:Tfp pilus assembly protein PilN
MVFKINLATRVYVDNRVTSLCLAAAVVLLLVLLAVDCVSIAQNAGEIKTLNGQLTAMEGKGRTAAKGVSPKNYQELLARIGFANSVIERKAYNWQQLLDRLELVVPEGVAVSTIVPDPKTRLLRLTGTARAFGNLRTFMEHLEDSRFFTDVYLLSQGETRLADKSPAINFAITCKVAMK